MKFLDTVTGPYTLTTAMADQPADTILAIPQGTTDVTRVGNKVTVKKVMLRGRFNLLDQAKSNPNGCSMRVMIVWDKQANGTAGVDGSVVLEQNNVYGFNNLDNSDRFQILKDKWYTLNPMTQTGSTANGFAEKLVRISCNNLNIPIMYSGATGAIGEIKSNNIIILVGGSTVDATFLWTTRVRYTDF